jgi:hypothetical protein
MKTSRRRFVQILQLTCAAALACLSAGAADPPPADSGRAPVNCSIQVTVLRCTGKSAVAPDKLRDCRQPSDLWQALRQAGSVDLLYHSTRTVWCDGQGNVDFVALETRPVIYLGGTTATNISHAYGMELHVRVYDAGAGPGPPLFVIDWDGSWSGSPQLKAKWESLAVRGFNAASKIPGITYQKTEEDEDGFVNMGKGSDISGLFKKKPKNKPPAASEKAAPDEPDYLDDPAFEKVSMAGVEMVSPGGMIVTRQRLAATDAVEELFFLISL